MINFSTTSLDLRSTLPTFAPINPKQLHNYVSLNPFLITETPLTIAAGLKTPGKVLIALVNGGALLDYRTKDGSTAMHRAIEKNSLEAVKTLLELGASPNYKDGKGLTPLYLSVTTKTDPLLCETLLHDHATIGANDLQGWQEVHQVG